MIDRSKSIARVQFLAAQRIEIGAQVVTPEAERLFGMIVRLSVPLGRMTSRQAMMDTLWPGVDDANARHNLRQTVYKAREIGLVIESGEDGLRLDPRHWSCDWDDPVGDVPGEWLHDYDPDFSAELRSWIASQRVGVHALIRPRIIRSLQTARTSGELLLADRHAAQLLRIDELNEEATLTRAELLAMQGAKVDALKLLDAYLAEIGRLGSGKDAALPAQLLRRRIAEKLPAVSYNNGSRHHGPLVGREREVKRLLAGLFDARAGRGAGFLVHGSDGMGKSRLLHEVRKSAILQGMRIVELSCESAPSVVPYAVLRSLVARLLECPGAYGISPEALGVVRGWVRSDPDPSLACPLIELEDLLAAISEETPLLVLVEHSDVSDSRTLESLNRVYRRGTRRHHTILVTTSAVPTLAGEQVSVEHFETLALRPLSIGEIQSIVAAYAQAEVPRATSDHVACASAFAEGNPMFGIEMLGLMLDSGSPDVIPWRVHVAVDRVVKALSELQLRLVVACDRLSDSARHLVVADALNARASDLLDAIDALEHSGHIVARSGVLRASGLVADAAASRVKASRLRLDASRAAISLARSLLEAFEPSDFYACLRLLLAADDETKAQAVLDRHFGSLVRRDTAQNIVFELSRLQRGATSAALMNQIEAIVNQVASGAANTRPQRQTGSHTRKPASLPEISPASLDVEYSLSSAEAVAKTLDAARDPSASPGRRLAEAATALYMAFNQNDTDGLKSAYAAVNAVRGAKNVNPIDIHRSDVIYSAAFGDRERTLSSAKLLANAARIVNDVELACKGLRNAAEALSTFGDIAGAQALLLESRVLASELEYHAQVARADLRLADLCIAGMDACGARAYLQSAGDIVEVHRIHSPLLLSDIAFFQCWESLVRSDFAQAQRAARGMERAFQGPRFGTALWTRLSVRLATFRGRRTKAESRDFELLKASIGSRHFYPTEQISLAALLLFSKETVEHDAVCVFVREQFPRLESAGREIWPFLLRSLGE